MYKSNSPAFSHFHFHLDLTLIFNLISLNPSLAKAYFANISCSLEFIFQTWSIAGNNAQSPILGSKDCVRDNLNCNLRTIYKDNLPTIGQQFESLCFTSSMNCVLILNSWSYENAGVCPFVMAISVKLAQHSNMNKFKILWTHTHTLGIFNWILLVVFHWCVIWDLDKCLLMIVFCSLLGSNVWVCITIRQSHHVSLASQDDNFRSQHFTTFKLKLHFGPSQSVSTEHLIHVKLKCIWIIVLKYTSIMWVHQVCFQTKLLISTCVQRYKVQSRMLICFIVPGLLRLFSGLITTIETVKSKRAL